MDQGEVDRRTREREKRRKKTERIEFRTAKHVPPTVLKPAVYVGMAVALGGYSLLGIWLIDAGEVPRELFIISWVVFGLVLVSYPSHAERFGTLDELLSKKYQAWKTYIARYQEAAFLDWERWRSGTLDYAEYLEEEIGSSTLAKEFDGFAAMRERRFKEDRDAFHMYILRGWTIVEEQGAYRFKGANLFRYRDHVEKRKTALGDLPSSQSDVERDAFAASARHVREVGEYESENPDVLAEIEARLEKYGPEEREHWRPKIRQDVMRDVKQQAKQVLAKAK